MTIKRIAATFLASFTVLTVFINTANAGSQEVEEIQHDPKAVIAFSKGLEKYAAAKGARAFIIARKGRPTNDLPAGIFYTHTAIAIYSSVTLTDGSAVNTYAIHNLYQTQEDKTKKTKRYNSGPKCNDHFASIFIHKRSIHSRPGEIPVGRTSETQGREFEAFLFLFCFKPFSTALYNKQRFQ